MVSIIIPTYNYAQFLAETLNSVLQQSTSEWECIIIDNGSTDHTVEVVRPFLADSRFIYFYQDNLGVSEGRNRGLREAKGEFIQFLDADDLLQSDKLKLMQTYLQEHTTCDLVYSDMRYFKTDDRSVFYHSWSCELRHDPVWMKYESGTGVKMATLFLEGNNMVISSPVFRADLIRKNGYFDSGLRYNEDWEFWLRQILKGARFDFLAGDNTWSLIRVHSKSASVNRFMMQICGYSVLQRYQSEFSNLGLVPAWNRRVEEHLEAIRKSIIQTNSNEQFHEYLSVLKQQSMYNLFFKREVNLVFFAKLLLRFKRLA
jgi:glycosyltransferase involved in cell wall biosynthesis